MYVTKTRKLFGCDSNSHVNFFDKILFFKLTFTGQKLQLL